ncbi:ABC-2 type transport system permease protein [Lentibacillus halodurans]|uniref:ABC-2 type transport system permease protein n=1 Tax=Lentibacillus halodurans TaxID=237679 RepID=A0A1I0ZIY3_9BACI|nr:ABC transporter permease [Lentibacillus halodurans]SFB24490.1 ABC-2 type transport system permease protein [Lentibacillus halodurans]
MKQIMATRFMHWKKQWVSIIFWLLFPILATTGITAITETLQDDTKVPVGIVMEEQTAASEELVQDIKSTPFIRAEILSENQSLHDLEKHELDSVFVIHEGFEENVQRDHRDRLITSFQSDLSFAYSAVKEMILSYVQQETGRSKAAFVVQELEQQHNGNTGWTYEEITAKSKEIQQDENLLDTAFSFDDTVMEANQTPPLFPIWGLWSICTLLSTMLVFDWVIKEKRSKAILRLAFSRWSLKSYLLQNFMLYSVVLFLVDLVTVSIFLFMFGEWISVVSLIVYRLFINMAAFLFAHLFRNTLLYYTVSFALVLIVGISSGAVLPAASIDSPAWFDFVNPLAPLLSGEYVNLWSVMIMVLAVFWLVRKERFHA